LRKESIADLRSIKNSLILSSTHRKPRFDDEGTAKLATASSPPDNSTRVDTRLIGSVTPQARLRK
jgi:hypothetical protein